MPGVDVLVAGAGGFIGGHLVLDLARQGLAVRAVDRKPLDEWYQVEVTAENVQADLSELSAARAAVTDVRIVYNLAADMGGMGFIENNKAACMLSVLTSSHVLLAAKEQQVERYFYASSACVYAAGKQMDAQTIPLREEDAYPAMPEDGYGWEKLFSERMCRHFFEDYATPTRVARFHNVYGPHGTWTGGREKAPAAVCRKVAEAVLNNHDEIEIWGDGEQTRSFMFIDDCLKGTQLIANGDSPEPVNLGSSELVSINELVTLVEDIAGVRLRRRHLLDAPRGVRGRNSDNSMIRQVYGWEPDISLRNGLTATYAWVYDQVKRSVS